MKRRNLQPDTDYCNSTRTTGEVNLQFDQAAVKLPSLSAQDSAECPRMRGAGNRDGVGPPSSPKRVAWPAVLVLCLGSLLSVIGCHSSLPPAEDPVPEVAVGDANLHIAGLTDVSAELGIQFTHDAGETTGFPMPQIMGSGGAFLDADQDGRLDVLLLDGAPVDEQDAGCRLYRQRVDGRFEDLTEHSGLRNPGFGMGVAVGDIDNDGQLDVYFSNFGPDRLFRNLGECRFEDVTESSGIRNEGWGTAAAFFDYDQDGWLDLFVANYLDYFPGSVCTDATGRRDYCGPMSFPGAPDKLYRNTATDHVSGVPHFEDVSLEAGLGLARQKGLGVVCRDFTGDRRPDIFVANDQEANGLWIQQPDGTFVDEAALRGVALNGLGRAEANMGVVCDDLNGDGAFDLFVTHLRGETNTLFVGNAAGYFIDQTATSGLGPPSLRNTGFGTVAADLECDGDLDLLVVNGRVKRDPFLAVRSSADAADWRDYAELNQIFVNRGEGRFQEEVRGVPFTVPVDVSRGLAAGDYDGDGDVDFLVTNAAGPCRLYRNDYARTGHWLAVRIFDPSLQRDAIGAQVRVSSGDRTFARELCPSTSYLCSHELIVYFGLGNILQIDQIEVIWPSGDPQVEVFPGGGVDRRMTLMHGAGVGNPVGTP